MVIFGQAAIHYQVKYKSLTINTYLCHPGEEQHYRPNGSSGETHFSSTRRRLLHSGHSQCPSSARAVVLVWSSLLFVYELQPVNLVRWLCNDR